MKFFSMHFIEVAQGPAGGYLGMTFRANVMIEKQRARSKLIFCGSTGHI